MTSIPVKLLLPRWTKRVLTEGGRDPLGLSRVAFMITDYLLSGIVTTTSRARYYSFYSWVLWNIANEEPPVDFQDFVDALRRREAAMALATLIDNDSARLVGVDETRKYFATGLQTGVFDCNFQVLPSNRMGNYGQNYSGSLYKLRLLETTEAGFDRVTPGTAEELARSFHESIVATPYIRKRLFLKKEISKSDLIKSSEFLSLDALSESFTSDERKRLTAIFFGLGDTDKIKGDTKMRRQTLTLLLHTISEFEEIGEPVIAQSRNHGFHLDEYLLYPMYFGCLWLSDDLIQPYAPPESLRLCNHFWRQLCLHDFFCLAVEDLLCAVLEVAGSADQGIPLEPISESLVSKDFFSFLSSVTRKRCDGPRAFLNALGIKSIPTEFFSSDYHKRLTPVHPLSEAQIVRLSATSPAEQIARAVLMVGVLYGKWRGMTNDVAMQYVSQRANLELWTGQLIPMIDAWFEPSASWSTVLEPLLRQFVVNQHERVFYQKGNLRSVWLKQSDGRIFKEQDYEPVWRNSRLLNCVSIMADLKLLKIDENDAVSLTAAGTRLMKKVLQEEA